MYGGGILARIAGLTETIFFGGMLLSGPREESRRTESGMRDADMRDAFDNAAVGLALLDADGNIIAANVALRAMFSRGESEIQGAAFNSLFYADGEVEEVLASTSYRGEGRLVRRDGESVPVEVRVSPLREGDARGVAVIEDITRQRRAEEAFVESEGRFRQLFENSVDALLIHDEAGRIVDCNVEAYRSLGYTREELLALSVKDIAEDVISEEEREARAGETSWQRAMSSLPGKPIGMHENRHRRKDGTTFPVEVALSSMNYGGRRMIFAAIRDITERKALEERLSYQAFHDSLTRLPNRALFMDRLEHALARGDRRGLGVAVLFLDLDNFKDVNDSFGHDTGDRLLVEIGDRLASCVRSADTVARLAGDEFTVLLEDVGSMQDAVLVVERIETVFREPVRLDARNLAVTASIGVVVEMSTGHSPQELLNYADTAMYRAKKAGKARYEIHGSGEPEGD